MALHQLECHYCNPSLGLTTKARGCKVAGQEGSMGVMPHAPGSARKCEGIEPHTPKGTPTLESRWTLECLESNCKGQNPMDRRVLYIIGKLLKCRCLIGLAWPFGHLKHKLWPKERLWVKLTIWFPTIKSQESTWFTCVQVACNTPLESSWRGLQLCFRPHFNPRSTHKLMGPQSRGSPNFGNFGTPTWESRDKNAIWMWASWRGT